MAEHHLTDRNRRDELDVHLLARTVDVHRRADAVDRQDPAATAAVVTRLDGEFTRPFLAHAAIAPSCAVAQFAPDGGLTVWAHTQGVYRLRFEVTDASNKKLIQPQEIVLQSILSYSEEQALAKEQGVVRTAVVAPAAAALAKRDDGDAPHLIYMPEVPFDMNRCLADIEACIRKHGFCSIVCGVRPRSLARYSRHRAPAAEARCSRKYASATSCISRRGKWAITPSGMWRYICGSTIRFEEGMMKPMRARG